MAYLRSGMVGCLRDQESAQKLCCPTTHSLSLAACILNLLYSRHFPILLTVREYVRTMDMAYDS
jgi:hypothetical protein